MQKLGSWMVCCAIGLVFYLVLSTPAQRAQRLPPDEPRVYVVGSVVNPQGVSLKEPMTLTQAVSVAGGPLKNAKYDQVNITRLSEKYRLSTCVSLKAIKKGRVADLQLQANDILDVVRGSCARPLRWEIHSDPPTMRVIK